MTQPRNKLTVMALTLAALGNAQATPADLADVPLANATTATMLPNIMFILDDSGSMDSDYMPDYVTSNYCRDNRDDGNMDSNLDSCDLGDPPYYASAFNRVYYNPLVEFTPPKNANGTSKTSYTTWTAVPKDGYGVQSSSTTNLVTSYPERVFCKNSYDNPYSTNCKSAISAGSYIYPNSTYPYPIIRYGAPFYYNVTVEWCSSRNTTGVDKYFGKSGTCQSRKTSTYKYVRYTNWTRIDIVPTTTSYAGPNGSTRTYAQEMTNFANWYAWARTRMQLMKTGVSQTFVDILGTPLDTDPADSLHARVGYTTISNTGTSDGTNYLAINTFDSAHKSTFFSRLFAADPVSWTPLRGALMKAGQIYAGQLGTDPVQFSCQRNFTILSTDGYWNNNIETATYGPYKTDGTNVGDQDGATGVTRPSYDALKKADTLADVAYYYYHTDLRPGTCAVCNNDVPPAGTDVNVDDVASHQHMTTFTIGLGVDGTLAYQDGYKTSTSGDYYNIKQGSISWPDPIANSGDQRIDDLWHAAVNGRGTYFSARDPNSLVTGLNQALGSISMSNGSGAAAAASSLQMTAGDNYIFFATYRTLFWDGELSAYTIDLSDGAVSATPFWQVSGQLASQIGSTGNTDTRVIKTWDSTGTNKVKNFNWSSLTTAERAYFDNSLLTQYANTWSAADQGYATGETLVNYLRGHDRNENQDRDTAYGTYYRLYRDRSKVLGDFVHSQPIYVKAPPYEFIDDGYDAFKTAQASRDSVVYVAANDGMLHTFDATTGSEKWAYIPPIQLKSLWRLADENYDTNHRYYLDGAISATDVKIGANWRSILVGAMGKGGRGVFAMDITDPDTPKALWNFTADNNANLGYTYGAPIITKLQDGTWVVLVASGYNNIPEGSSYTGADGVGRIFVLDAATGAVHKIITTGVGSVTTPSGLAHLNVKVNDFNKDNTAVQAYGGDLLGNLWRFDLEAGTASAILQLGASKPFGVTPEIGEIDSKTVLFVGTGRYLGEDDLELTDTQSFFAVKDDGSHTVTVSTDMIKLNMDASASRNITGSFTSADWGSKYGWYLDLPDSGERVNLAAQLVSGTVLFSTVVPTNTECQPGGYGYLYYVDYLTGQRVSSATSNAVKTTSPLVGLTVVKLPGGGTKYYGIKADGSSPLVGTTPTGGGGGGSSDDGRRVMWRELLN